MLKTINHIRSNSFQVKARSAQELERTQEKGIFVLVALVAIWIASTAPAIANSPIVSRLTEIQQQQADVLYTSDALSNLRVQYSHIQMWFLYRDPQFIYWSQEVENRIRQLQQVDQGSLAAAQNNLQQIAAMSPGAEPCAITGNDSLECALHTTQTLGMQLQQRSQQIFSSADATAWFNDWSTDWSNQLASTDGVTALQQDIEQFNVDFPGYQTYLDTLQQVNAKGAQLVADPAIAAAMNDFAQTYSDDVQTLMGMTDYQSVFDSYLEQGQAMVESNPEYQTLQSEIARLTQNLAQLRQSIHQTVNNCFQSGIGNSCFDPNVNTGLQALLPNFSKASNQSLVAVVQLTERASIFWYQFSKDPAARDLKQRSMDDLQASLAPIVQDLEAAYDNYISNIFSIAAIREHLGNLWDQLTQLGRNLGLVQ